MAGGWNGKQPPRWKKIKRFLNMNNDLGNCCLLSPSCCSFEVVHNRTNTRFLLNSLIYQRPNPVFLKDIPVRRFFQRLFKSDNVMFYISYSFDFVKSILWPKYNYLNTSIGVLYKLNFALKVSSKFLFQKKWNFSTLVAFQVRLLSRETTGTVPYKKRVLKSWTETSL